MNLSVHGHQPMASRDGRHVIVRNGEIYNFQEMRRALEKEGAAPAWRGHSDTEVLVEAVSAWGLDAAQARAVGMFAFALWDRATRSLHLARDRTGEKPLYYGWMRDAFVFGSELKATPGSMQRSTVTPSRSIAASGSRLRRPTSRSRPGMSLPRRCGRAIVATDVQGCREIVKNEVNGLLVPPSDTRALAAAIGRLLREPALRARMGAQRRALVEEHFTIDKVARATLSLYRELLEDRAA